MLLKKISQNVHILQIKDENSHDVVKNPELTETHEDLKYLVLYIVLIFEYTYCYYGLVSGDSTAHWASIHLADGRLTERSREVSKQRD